MSSVFVSIGVAVAFRLMPARAFARPSTSICAVSDLKIFLSFCTNIGSLSRKVAHTRNSGAESPPCTCGVPRFRVLSDLFELSFFRRGQIAWIQHRERFDPHRPYQLM